MKKFQNILNALPYSKPFLFVDKLLSVSENGVEGMYTFKKDEYFYQGHFNDKPITPGVILTECMAQIGVVCLGIYLLSDEAVFLNGNQSVPDYQIALSGIEIDFSLSVLPGETVTVTSIKEYYRFQKLKCKVIMKNAAGETVCKGRISGMTIKSKDEK